LVLLLGLGVKIHESGITGMQVSKFDLPLSGALIVNSVQLLAILTIALDALSLLFELLDSATLVLNFVVDDFHVSLLFQNLLANFISPSLAVLFQASFLFLDLCSIFGHASHFLLPSHNIGFPLLTLGFLLLKKPQTLGLFTLYAAVDAFKLRDMLLEISADLILFFHTFLQAITLLLKVL
jgi:hypothetical protein